MRNWINRLKCKAEAWVYKRALEYVCSNSVDHRDLHDFLNQPEYKDIGWRISREMKGLKLKFEFVEAKERGWGKYLQDVISSPSPMWSGLKRDHVSVGRVINFPIPYDEFPKTVTTEDLVTKKGEKT